MDARREQRLRDVIVRLMRDATSSDDREDRLQVFVDETVALFDAHAAGVLLFGRSGDLQVAASTGHHSGLLELLQIETDQGPCLEAARTGDPELVRRAVLVDPNASSTLTPAEIWALCDTMTQAHADLLPRALGGRLE